MTAGMLLYRERRILYPVAFRAIPEHMFGKARNAARSTESYNFSTLTESLGLRSWKRSSRPCLWIFPLSAPTTG
jgi:hypothetical protein